MCDMLKGSVERIVRSSFLLRLIDRLRLLALIVVHKDISYAVDTQVSVRSAYHILFLKLFHPDHPWRREERNSSAHIIISPHLGIQPRTKCLYIISGLTLGRATCSHLRTWYYVFIVAWMCDQHNWLWHECAHGYRSTRTQRIQDYPVLIPFVCSTIYIEVWQSLSLYLYLFFSSLTEQNIISGMS